MTPIAVGFDATPVISGRTGIARYVTQLGLALEQHDVQLRRFAIGRNAFAVPERTTHLRVPARVVAASWRLLGRPRLEQLFGDVDVVHATGLLMPPSRRPLVVTVHDMAALRHPELHPERHVHQQRAQLARLDRAASIVTVSTATADDLVHLGVAAGRLVVAPLGLTRLVDPRPSDERIPGQFLLTVGETAPRKGYGVLMRALARVGGHLRLVMAGPAAGDDARLRTLAADLAVADRVAFLGPVSDARLAALYRDATALCFPSVAEGFGLPVLEAMATGLPVIANDIPAVRELAAGCAVYVTRGDERAWADAIDGVVHDNALRDRLAIEGRDRASEFTWARTASATIQAYRHALERGPA